VRAYNAAFGTKQKSDVCFHARAFVLPMDLRAPTAYLFIFGATAAAELCVCCVWMNVSSVSSLDIAGNQQWRYSNVAVD
jgi:hypothetical protein